MNRSVMQLVVFIIWLFGVRVCAQSLDIKLVNGRTGKPIAGTHVNVWVGSERKEALAIPTNNGGIAQLRFTDRDSEIDIHSQPNRGMFGVADPVVKYEDTLRVNVGYVLCQPGKQDYSWLAIMNFSTKELVEHGVVTPNTCGKANAAATPGRLVIFVRPLTWLETLKQ